MNIKSKIEISGDITPEKLVKIMNALNALGASNIKINGGTIVASGDIIYI